MDLDILREEKVMRSSGSIKPINYKREGDKRNTGGGTKQGPEGLEQDGKMLQVSGPIPSEQNKKTSLKGSERGGLRNRKEEKPFKKKKRAKKWEGKKNRVNAGEEKKVVRETSFPK